MLASVAQAQLDQLSPERLREFAAQLIHELQTKESLITRLTHEMALLKRIRFAARSEQFNAAQQSLFDEDTEADLQALSDQLESLSDQSKDSEESPATKPKRGPRRQVLPSDIPRREIRHEPASTICGCGCALKRIGEDVSEKLDFVPGVFSVERHIRGKWVCGHCETLVQAPVPAHVIDKGLPTTRLLAQVLVSKYVDHMPLYRQEHMFARAGLALSRSTMAQWVGTVGQQLQPLVDAMREHLLQQSVLHADETPVSMLAPGKGKTHRAYLWSYCSTIYDPVSAVVFDFTESRSGKNAGRFLGFDDERPQAGWRGKLLCDEFSGYRHLFPKGVVEAGCLAHARRKFFDLWAGHKSIIAEQALKFFQLLYKAEQEMVGLDTAEARREWRQTHAKPVADTFHKWLIAQRQLVPNGSATAKAIDYSLRRWEALTRYLNDGELPPDNNRVENLIRPIAVGRSNWLFAGSLRAGQRAAAVMSLIHTARINGHEPLAYLTDVLDRLPTQPASRIDELLPYNWQSKPIPQPDTLAAA
jgi:transposase